MTSRSAGPSRCSGESACPTGWTTSPRELSVGQQQRVALARMLANDPAVILADEPTGNLDPETSASIMDFLAELNREGRTIVMVTHDLRLAARAKRSLRLVAGQIQSSGSPS